jgi:hypothetical protein
LFHRSFANSFERGVVEFAAIVFAHTATISRPEDQVQIFTISFSMAATVDLVSRAGS